MNTAHWNPAETPLVILADGCFGQSQSKLALGVIRYGQWPIAAVIDSAQAGKTVREVTGMPCDAPIVPNLEAAWATQPKALLIGTAPPGGTLPPEWRTILAQAIRQGLHIINGLHFFITEEPDLVALAAQHQVKLWDVRDPEAYGKHKFQVINLQAPRPKTLRVITMVGSDCSVGKMHTALELHAHSQNQGQSSRFLATGQTGILIAGRGVPLDRVIGDFMAGAIEVCLQEEIATLAEIPNSSTHWIFVEGQGSLLHPAYSGVTLSLMHGANPDALILCHKAPQESIRNYPQVKIPPIKDLISLYEQAASWVRPQGIASAKVAGVAVNSSALSEPEARRYLDQLADETGLPVTDPVRYGVAALFESLKTQCALPPVRSVGSFSLSEKEAL
jgi:uncharacterized NAD-dependent epimerase/dehydratase family protein